MINIIDIESSIISAETTLMERGVSIAFILARKRTQLARSGECQMDRCFFFRYILLPV